MNLMPIKIFFKRGASFLGKHAPTILTVMGAGGAVSSVIFAVKATPKAEMLIQEQKRKLNKNRLTPMETAKACWKVYIPTAGMLVTTLGCIVGANCINLRRNAALASLLAASRHEFSEMHQKMVETIGEEKTKEIHEQVQKKLAAEEPEKEKGGFNRSTVIRCVDTMTGQEFRASRDQLDLLHYMIRDMVRNEGAVSKNEVLELFHEHSVDDGDGTGWTDQTGFELQVKLMEEDGEYYYAVSYLIPPVERYNYLY